MNSKKMIAAGLVLLGLVAGSQCGETNPLPALASHPCPIAADLWLLGGQSNMDGQDYVKKYPSPEDSRIVSFDMANRWITAKDPVHRIFEAVAPVHKKLIMQWFCFNGTNLVETEKAIDVCRNDLRNNPRGVGPGLAFAQTVLRETGRPIGLIPCAHGGTSMDQWNSALKDQGDESFYGAMMNRVKMIGDGGKIKGLLWYQGESETSPGLPDVFEKKFLNFIDAVRRDLGQPNLPIIYVQIGRYVPGPELADGYEQIREWQRRIVGKRKNIYFTTAIDQTLFDAIHVTGSGQQCLGRRMAELALTYVYGKSGHGQQINLESVRYTSGDNMIHVKFSGVTGRLQSPGRPGTFELRGPGPEKAKNPRIFRVDFDEQHPDTLNLAVEGAVTGSVKLVCGSGMDPYMNVVDDRNMPIPAFGPVDVMMAQ